MCHFDKAKAVQIALRLEANIQIVLIIKVVRIGQGQIKMSAVLKVFVQPNYRIRVINHLPRRVKKWTILKKIAKNIKEYSCLFCR